MECKHTRIHTYIYTYIQPSIHACTQTTMHDVTCIHTGTGNTVRGRHNHAQTCRQAITHTYIQAYKPYTHRQLQNSHETIYTSQHFYPYCYVSHFPMTTPDRSIARVLGVPRRARREGDSPSHSYLRDTHIRTVEGHWCSWAIDH